MNKTRAIQLLVMVLSVVFPSAGSIAQCKYKVVIPRIKNVGSSYAVSVSSGQRPYFLGRVGSSTFFVARGERGALIKRPIENRIYSHSASKITSNGTVYGGMSNGKSFLYKVNSRGEVTILETPPNQSIQAINDEGWLVVREPIRSETPEVRPRMILAKPLPGGGFQSTEILAGEYEPNIHTMNNAGYVGGSVFDDQIQRFRGFIWKDGQQLELESNFGLTVLGINSYGDAVGGGPARARIGNTLTQLLPDGFKTSYGIGISNSQEVLFRTTYPADKLFLFTPSEGMQNLQDLICWNTSRLRGVSLSEDAPAAISEDGNIAVTLLTERRKSRAAILIPMR